MRISDWISDVCSSDLRDHIGAADRLALRPVRLARHFPAHWRARLYLARPLALVLQGRSRQASGTRRGRTPIYPDRPHRGGTGRRPPRAARRTAALSPELGRHPVALLPRSRLVALRLVAADLSGRNLRLRRQAEDRKSTRLNSSH